MVIPLGGVQVIIGVLIAFDYLAVGLRLWARKIKGKPLQINDYLIVVGLFLTNCLCICEVLVRTPSFYSHHYSYKDTMLYIATWLLWIVAVTSIRVSILHLYIVIFRKTWFHRMAYALMFICTVWCIAFIVSYSLDCRPLAMKPSISCVLGKQSLRDFIGNGLNLGLDVVILSMPMPLLWALHIPLKKKMALCAIFGIGFGISVFGGVRQKAIVAASSADFTASYDFDLGLWLAAEPLLAIITASLPLIAPAFEKLSIYCRRLRTQRLQESNTNRELNNHGWALSSFHRDRPNPHRFERLHTGPRSHRMADSVESSFHTTTISSVSPALLPNQDHHGHINVTTDWAVESSSCVV